MKREVKAYGISGTSEHDWTCSPALGLTEERGGLCCPDPCSPGPSGGWCCPSSAVDVNLVTAGVCLSHLCICLWNLFFVVLVLWGFLVCVFLLLLVWLVCLFVFNLLLCCLLEEFEEKRQKCVLIKKSLLEKQLTEVIFNIFCYCLAKYCPYLSALLLTCWSEACR